VQDALHDAGLTSADQLLPPSVHVKHGVNPAGKHLHYYLNYSSSPASFPYAYPAGRDLLTGHTAGAGTTMSLAAWDLAIVEEDR